MNGATEMIVSVKISTLECAHIVSDMNAALGSKMIILSFFSNSSQIQNASQAHFNL